MIQQYFKQAWQLILQNRLFSAIHIAGTALAVSMVMVIAIFFHLKTGDIYPEMERNRLLFVKNAEIQSKDSTEQYYASSSLSRQFIKDCFGNLQSLEAVTATYRNYRQNDKVRVPGAATDKKVYVKFIDANFWKVYQFRFQEGKPFSQEEFDAAIPVVVISESLSRHLFPDGRAEGKYLVMNGKEYRVNGVVKDASYLLQESFAHIWLPYTLHPSHDEAFSMGSDVLGSYSVVMLMKKPGDIRAVRDEIDDNVQRYGAGLAHSISLLGQPDNVLKSSFRRGNTPLDINGILLKFSLVLCIFMVVPAINLSGLNSGRMEKRLAEMGVRKAFGAPNGALLRQILIENFLLTLIGAFAGLLISWLLVVVFSDILFNTFFGPSDTGIIIGNTPGVTPRMLINLTVFALTFLTALLVNVLSAIIPAYRFTKKNITDSLNDNYTL